jgi:hypothetical protein
MRVEDKEFYDDWAEELDKEFEIAGQGKIKAQELWDIRSLTGVISGQDIFEMFRRLAGDPSPKGDHLLDLSAVEADEMGAQLLMKGNSPLRNVLEEIKDYCDIP